MDQLRTDSMQHTSMGSLQTIDQITFVGLQLRKTSGIKFDTGPTSSVLEIPHQNWVNPKY
jgi:hypothetical protein